MDIKIVADFFIRWTKRKIRHHINNNRKIYFREKEIWWVALGKNIGCEIDGKNELFERPVLIIRKYSRDMCFVLPLSTQIKTPKPWYQVIVHLGEEERAVNITQGRSISFRRLLRKQAVLNTQDYNRVIETFILQFKKV